MNLKTLYFRIDINKFEDNVLRQNLFFKTPNYYVFIIYYFMYPFYVFQFLCTF
jgi:hypothetical protein